MVLQKLKIEGSLQSNGKPVRNEHVGIYDLKSYEYLDNALTDMDGNFSLTVNRKNLKNSRFEVSIPRYSTTRSKINKDYNNFIKIPIKEVFVTSIVFDVGIIELTDFLTKTRTSRKN